MTTTFIFGIFMVNIDIIKRIRESKISNKVLVDVADRLANRKCKGLLVAKLLLDAVRVTSLDLKEYMKRFAEMYLTFRHGYDWDRVLRYGLWGTPCQQYRTIAEIVYFWYDIDNCNSYEELIERQEKDAIELANILGNIWKRTCGE